MFPFSRKKKHNPSKSQSQSHSQSPQQKYRSQPVYPWSAHAPPSGLSPLPFHRPHHALSTTATAAGENFLFGGYLRSSCSASNDLYVFSTRDLSTTLLRTSGEVPSPRMGHAAVLTSTVLLIWGGKATLQDVPNQREDDSFYLLNLVSREWSRVVVNGPGPGGRFKHTMTIVGSELFIFGGRIGGTYFNDIWAFNLGCLESNPRWESYEPASGNEKPPPRAHHVSVTTGDHIIIFGGSMKATYYLNDTWSFDISTRKWTELQCTGSTPSPRAYHAAVLVGDVMYVFGGHAFDGTKLGDLTALNLSTWQWIAFQDIGPSPGARCGHAMASDGTRVFVLGGSLSSADAVTDETAHIHVLDTRNTELLKYPEPNLNAVNPNEKTIHLAQKSFTGPPPQGQLQQLTSSSSDDHVAHDASPFQEVTHQELDLPVSPQISRERNPNPNDLSSQPSGVSDRPRRVPDDYDASEGSTEYRAKFVAHDTSSEGEVVRLEHERLADLEQQLLASLAAQIERDRRIGQLTDDLALKSALLEESERNAAQAKRRAGLELRELQAKLDKSLLSHDRALEQAQSAVQKARSRAADADDRSQPAYEQIGRYKTELAEVRAELEGKKSKLETIRLRLRDAENDCAKSRAEAETLCAQSTAGPVNMDEDRVARRIMERLRTMEAKIESLRGNEKSFEMMECTNEG